MWFWRVVGLAGLSDSAASGDRLSTLQALRDVLAHVIECEQTPASAVASLARQLTLVLAEIERLAPPEQKGTPLDQLEQRRRARGAKTAGVDAADGSTGQG
jgi:hypothetical protein